MHGIIDPSAPINWDSSLNRGLVAWWLALPDQQRGNVFRDLCGKHDSTLINGTAWDGSRGRMGGYGSLLFDGTNDYVESTTAGNSLAIVGTGDFSIFSWIRFTASGRDDFFVWKSSDASDDVSMYKNASNRLESFMRIDGGSNHITTSAGSLSTATWYQVGLIRLAGTVRLYINGKQDGSASVSIDLTNHGTGRVWLGSNHTAFSPLSSFNHAGHQDGVRLYTRAVDALLLYEEEIRGCPTTLNWHRPKVYFDMGAAPAAGNPWYYQHLLAG